MMYDFYLRLNENAGDMLKFLSSNGYSGACLVFEYRERKDVAINRENFKKLKNDKLALFLGAEINEENPEFVKKKICELRGNVDFVFVRVVNEKVTQAALGMGGVDFITGLENSRESCNQVTAKFARDKEVGVVIDFSYMLRSSGFGLVSAINRVLFVLKLWKKYGFGRVWGSGASDALSLRSAEEAASVLELLGLGQKGAKDALLCAGDKIKIMADKRSGNYIMKGVRLISGETSTPVPQARTARKRP